MDRNSGDPDLCRDWWCVRDYQGGVVMARSTKEWIGKSDDSAVPDRVRLRVLDRYNKTCAGCGMPLIGQPWTCDHIVALINAGENRERNLQPLGDKCCNKKKNADDVAQKSATYQTRRAHYLKRKPKGRPMPGTRASGLRKRMSGVVERWPQ